MNYTAPFIPLCAIAPVNSLIGITAVSDGRVVIIVDMMKLRGAFRVAPSSYRRKWLWWTSEVLMEAQGSTAHLLFLISSCHKQSTVTKSPHHHHFLLHLISSHKHTLASTFSALIFSSSHQSPSGLTAATSDPSVHESFSHSLPLFPPQSSLCLSQSISPLENRQTPWC